MSALAYILEFVFFAFSPFGMFAFFLGVAMFMLAPTVPMVTNRFHRLGGLHMWTATRMLKRAAFVVTPQSDLLLKRMSPDDTGTEKIAFNDITKEFEDPTNALHWWYGIPFALADEVHGILFDPRHAAVGAREKHLRDKDRHEWRTTRQEQESYGVLNWAHAVYEFGRDTYEIVTLEAVRYLIQGSEKAEHPARVGSMYENSRAPYNEGRKAREWAMILAAVLGPFVAIWILSSQLGGGGGGSTIGFSLLAIASLQGKDILRHLVTVVLALVLILPFVAVYALLFLFAGPVIATFLFLILGWGFWFVPVMCLLVGRVSTTFADSVSNLLFRLGFSGYDDPIFVWTDQQYQVRELDHLDNVDRSDAAWYGFAGDLVGFTFDPGPESWDSGHVDAAEIENKMVKPTGNTNLPGDVRIWDGQVRDKIGAVVPRRLRDDCYYLYSALVLEQFTYAATGEKSTTRLTQKKDEVGEDHGMSEGRFGTIMLVGGVFSLLLGVGVFLL